VRKIVGKAVDDSIVEILPPVVDRSVLIVQNLAGSLALVTCREPLRMSLTTNLKKSFESHFKIDLGLNVIPL